MDSIEKNLQELVAKKLAAGVNDVETHHLKAELSTVKKYAFTKNGFIFLTISVWLITAALFYSGLQNYKIFKENQALKAQLNPVIIAEPQIIPVKFSQFKVIDPANNCASGLIKSVGTVNFCDAI